MNKEKNKDKKIFQLVIIISLVVSLLVGGVAGGIIGLAVSTSQGEVFSWIAKNILGLPGGGKPLFFKEEPKTIQVQEESATIEVVKKVTPSVVSIIITKDLSKIFNMTGPDIFPFDDFFEFGFPGFRFTFPDLPRGPQEVGGGTGFIISEDGLILTNKHVVADTEAEYTVITSKDDKYPAKILATDPVNDIAVIKIETSGLPVVELGDSDTLQIGQTVIAIGNTLAEYPNTVTKGIISGIGRTIVASGTTGQEVIEEAIQTDTAINPGSSGGPLLNLAGQVVGVNTAISREGQLVGFAIPINQAKKTIESVKKFGKVIRPLLGVRYILIDKRIAEANNLEVNYGALIIRGEERGELAVIPGSPADKAGIVENDIILEINGQKIDKTHSLAREINKYQPGEEIDLKILHKGKEKVIKVELAEFKQ